FLERPWFTRVWVIQEAIASKEFTVMCGCWKMNGASFFTVLEAVLEWRLPCLPVHSENQDMWGDNASRSIRQIWLLLNLGIREKGYLAPTPKGHRLISLLERSRHARSTDPRDRV